MRGLVLSFSLALIRTAAAAPTLAAAPEASAAFALPREIQAAVDAAVTIPGARAVVESLTPALPRGCTIERVELPGAPLAGSGQAAVRLYGRGCPSWAWLRVTLSAPVAVAIRAVAAGEPLAGAMVMETRAITAGRVPFSPLPDAVAVRPIGPGKVIQPDQIRAAAGPGAGQPVQVIVRAGALAIEARGRLVACGRARSCAVLASGKNVEGRLEDGRLVVQAP